MAPSTLRSRRWRHQAVKGSGCGPKKVPRSNPAQGHPDPGSLLAFWRSLSEVTAAQLEAVVGDGVLCTDLPKTHEGSQSDGT